MIAAPWLHTPEAKAKAAETRRRNSEARKAGKTPRPPRPAAKPRLETAPVRTAGVVTEKMRRKMVSIIARVVKLTEGTALWTMKRAERPVYAIDAVSGKVLLDEKKRPIIDRKVRAVSDETIAADRLEEWEQVWLAEELTNELIKYKRLRTFLIRMVELEERSSLPMCVTIIALPRLARHGILPSEFQGMIEEMREAARKARHAPLPVPPATPEPAAATVTEPLAESWMSARTIVPPVKIPTTAAAE